MNQYIKRGLAVALVSGFSMAQAAVDVTAATAEITDSKTAVLAIGLAVFGVAVGVKLYKWLKNAL
ncbi:MAG: major capsid protein [Pseudomonadota bacterium]